MSRKPPSSEDLRDLLPVVWGPGCRDDSVSEARMRVRGWDSGEKNDPPGVSEDEGEGEEMA